MKKSIDWAFWIVESQKNLAPSWEIDIVVSWVKNNVNEKIKNIKLNFWLTPLEQFEFIKKKSYSFIELSPLVEYIEKWMPMSTEERINVLKILDISFMKLISLTSSIKQELDELEKIAKWEDIWELVPYEEISSEEWIGDVPNIDIKISEEKIQEDDEIIEKRRKDAQEKEERKQRKTDNQRIIIELSQIEKLLWEWKNHEAFLIAKNLEEEFSKNKKVKEMAAKCRKLVKG